HGASSVRQTPAPRLASSIPTRSDPHTASADTSHSHITHLIEFGYPERFVQEQVGHTYASTTALYTWVSDEYRNRLLEASLRRRTERTGGKGLGPR
ncbi:integrase, partial [Kitasatospora sp. NPDC059327]|uniref:integrase n=1 Tax=Kitasatospora sp. NPDC059327 TaxID=3346803 RepID=UPI0036A70452